MSLLVYLSKFLASSILLCKIILLGEGKLQIQTVDPFGLYFYTFYCNIPRFVCPVSFTITTVPKMSVIDAGLEVVNY